MSGYVPLQRDPYSAHQMVIDRCRGARRVLDVGCSDGAIAAEISRRYGAVVDGVEADPVAAEEARIRCGRLLEGPIEAVDLRALGPEPYDVIVLADVLEHLTAPLDTVQKLVPLLGRAGRMVISTPNVANWSVRLMLLAGRWEYTDRGILDRTHVHLFTRRSLLRLLGEAGLAIEEVDVTCPLPVLRREPFTRVAHLLASKAPRLLAYQFVVTAAPG